VGERKNKPGRSKRDPEPTVKSIVLFVNEKFPEVNISEYTIGDLENYWEDDFSNLNKQQELVDNIVNNLKTKDYYSYIGTTKNPEVSIKSNFNEAVSERSNSIEKNIYPNTVSILDETQALPFRNADKRITFWLADSFGIVDNLLNTTWSCEGYQSDTNNFSNICGECWWCLEREWAHQEYKK
jgi:hypothetical protein